MPICIQMDIHIYIYIFMYIHVCFTPPMIQLVSHWGGVQFVERGFPSQAFLSSCIDINKRGQRYGSKFYGDSLQRSKLQDSELSILWYSLIHMNESSYLNIRIHKRSWSFIIAGFHGLFSPWLASHRVHPQWTIPGLHYTCPCAKYPWAASPEEAVLCPRVWLFFSAAQDTSERTRGNCWRILSMTNNYRSNKLYVFLYISTWLILVHIQTYSSLQITHAMFVSKQHQANMYM